MVVQTWLEELSPGECDLRLRSSVLGRIAVLVDGRPEIFPVNHVVDASGAVVFPSNERTKLWAALSWPWTCFEVDGIDPDGRSGWSVMVVGHAELVEQPEEIARVAAARQVLWAVGSTTRWVRIVPGRVTGRRISAVHAP